MNEAGDMTEVKVPDIGDFDQVDVIEVLVSPGDEIKKDDSLITLESDKATMEIPSPYTGVVEEVLVAVNDKVSKGSPILKLQLQDTQPAQAETEADTEAETQAAPEAETKQTQPNKRPNKEQPQADRHTEVLVLGAGPGGYTAAFRAADLGKRVTLVERYSTLGGVCLNVGCIPSKALLHVAGLMDAIEMMRNQGVDYGTPAIDTDRINAWKDGVVKRLTDGLAQLAQKRNVEVIQGQAHFESEHRLVINTAEGDITLAFEQAIIAAGSRPVWLPDLPPDLFEHDRIMDSTRALQLSDIPDRLLVIGGGIIGLELATVYHALGSEVTIVEKGDRLLKGTDADLVRVLQKRIDGRYAGIHLNTSVAAISSKDDGFEVRFEAQGNAPKTHIFDRVLIAIGRRPNSDAINASATGVEIDTKGFIKVDQQQRTRVPHIFAIGDIVGEPQLAHKATHQGKVAAEVIAGQPAAFDARAIPAVAYTDPEVAWMGLTEEQAKEKNIDINVARFPWSANGRALGMGRSEGITKLIFEKSDSEKNNGEKNSGRLLGAGIVGPHAGDLIAETVHALEMGADAEDIALTIHPHPTLSETIAFAAEMAHGSITDLYQPKKSK